MKTQFKYILYLFLALFVAYLIIAIVSMDFDLSEWSPLRKGLFIYSSTILFTHLEYIKPIKDNE